MSSNKSIRFLEKSLEDIIMETDNDILTDRGFFIEGSKVRQVYLDSINICDILNIRKEVIKSKIDNTDYTCFFINVIELKRDSISFDTLRQASRYVDVLKYNDKHLESYSAMRARDENCKIFFEVTLCGNNADLDLWNFSTLYNKSFDPLMSEEFTISTLKCYEYGFNIDGLKFNELKK